MKPHNHARYAKLANDVAFFTRTWTTSAMPNMWFPCCFQVPKILVISCSSSLKPMEPIQIAAWNAQSNCFRRWGSRQSNRCWVPQNPGWTWRPKKISTNTQMNFVRQFSKGWRILKSWEKTEQNQNCQGRQACHAAFSWPTSHPGLSIPTGRWPRAGTVVCQSAWPKCHGGGFGQHPRSSVLLPHERLPVSCEVTKVPAKCLATNEPMIVSVVMLQLGAKNVVKNLPTQCLEVPEVDN